MEGLFLSTEMLLPGHKMCKIDLKDAYFAIPLSVKSRKYVRFQWKGFLYEFCCLCFGLSPAPLVFTKLLKVPIFLSLEKTQCKNNNLPRQHTTNGIFIRGLVDGKRYTDIHISTLTFSDQYQKVLPRAIIDFRISRGDSRFRGSDFEPSQGKTPKSTESLPGNPRKWEINSQETKQTDWEVIIDSNSSPSSTPPLSSSSTSTNLEINLSQLFRGESGHFGGGKERTVMVERKFNSLQPEIFNFFPTTNNNKLRCITTRLGSELSRTDNRGAMVQGGTKFHINVLELKAAKLAIMSFTLKERDAISIDTCMDNITAPSYLMKIGGTKSQELTAISKEIWQYLLKWKIKIAAEYLPGSMNEKADRESRQSRDSSKWKLNPTIFMKLCQIRGTPQVDLEGITPITPTTYPGKAILSVKAGMLFRYPGLTSLCTLFPLLHSLEGFFRK